MSDAAAVDLGPTATAFPAPDLDRPILIIGCNRSGTTLVFNTLAEHPRTWSLYEESQHVFYEHYPIHPQLGDRIVEPPTPAAAERITRAFVEQAHNKEIFKDRAVLRHVPRKALQRPLNRLYKRPPLRLVEKTPANSLRIPFLVHLFPDAHIVFVVRRPEDTISSLMEGWKNWSNTGDDPWVFGKWHYLVPPGWQEWTGRPLADICAFQWLESTRTALRDLEAHRPSAYLMVRYEDVVADPVGSFARIRHHCELEASSYFDRLVRASDRRVFTHGGSRPRPDKWRTLHGTEIERVRPIFAEFASELYSDEP